MNNQIIKQAASFAASLLASYLRPVAYPAFSFTGGFDVIEAPADAQIDFTIRLAAIMNDIYFNLGTNYKSWLELLVRDNQITLVSMYVYKVTDAGDSMEPNYMFDVPTNFDLLTANITTLSNFSTLVGNIMSHYPVAKFMRKADVNTGVIDVDLELWPFTLAMSQDSYNVKSTVPALLNGCLAVAVPDCINLIAGQPKLTAVCTGYQIGEPDLEEIDPFDVDEPTTKAEADMAHGDGLDETYAIPVNASEPTPEEDDESFADAMADILTDDNWESEIDPDYYKPINLPSVLSTFPDSDLRWVLARNYIPATPIYRGSLGIPNWLRTPETVLSNSIQLEVLPIACCDIDTPDSKSEYMQDIYTGYAIRLGDRLLVTIFKTTVTQAKGNSEPSLYSVRCFVFVCKWDTEEETLDLAKFANRCDTYLEMVDQRTNANVSKSIIRKVLSMQAQVAIKAGYGAEYEAYQIGNPEQYWARNRSGS